ncbi:type I-C CRISPR-associated protein Cas8c/Csd1 [uncultured Acidaminococcus sp.]|uniref:type I-C CRISPR-associated protein Cas8c/Csd1 n=1 Tax=uncultured Acidaminococcus sp. TaxID=352152 RepID=UPI002614491B|nr:type I-C CRISPR-associated protein Cas8c/Csd1 [uncultured Acidaminococcus sp.]
MILQALVKYYETLLKQGKVEEPGWSAAKVSAEIQLDEEGKLLGILSLQNEVQRGRKTALTDPLLQVPEVFKRSSGVRPNFLYDGSSYFFGVDNKGNPKRSIQCFEAARTFHHQLLDGCDSPVAQGVLKFFDSWQPDKAEENPVFQQNRDVIVGASGLVFAVNGQEAQQDPEIRRRWMDYKNEGGGENSEKGQCLVTGKVAEIALTHPNIKGVRDAQSSGAALVSFNAPSLESFGHADDQGLNAPVSEYAAFAYTTALNQLIREGNSLLCGDTTVVFWAQSGEPLYQQVYLGFLNPSGNGENKEDTVKAVLEKILQGVAVDVDGITLSPDELFYVLGLAPNAARLSVRFFWQNTFGVTLQHLQNHQERLKIVRPSWEKERGAYLPLWRLLKESVNPNATKKQALPLLAGSLLRSILQDAPYPEAMYRQFLLRIKAESGDAKISYPRAAFVKAYLLKNHQEKWGGEITMNVNENCKAVPYVLGRMFAVLEGLQQDSSEVSATIKDRYFNAACATPGAVFPVLLKLANAHLNKLGRTNKGLAVNTQKKLGSLMEKITMPDEGNPIPGRLTLDEQGMFILGYYQETQARYTKKEEQA